MKILKIKKMNFEFYMYKDLMKNWGWDSEVVEASSLKINNDEKVVSSSNEEIHFIYNRLTDFYLTKWKAIRKAYEKQNVCLSPNPKEYSLLAHKKHLCSLYNYAQEHKHPILTQTLIPSYFMESPEKKFWNNKKQFFFKPVQSYGGKGSYRGKSITNKRFLSLENYIAQEYIPPPLWKDPIL